MTFFERGVIPVDIEQGLLVVALLVPRSSWYVRWVTEILEAIGVDVAETFSYGEFFAAFERARLSDGSSVGGVAGLWCHGDSLPCQLPLSTAQCRRGCLHQRSRLTEGFPSRQASKVATVRNCFRPRYRQTKHRPDH